MTPAPEFLIESTLKDGLAALKDDTSLLDDLLAFYPAEFREEAKSYVAGHNFDVIQNWPTAALVQPTIAIVNAGTNESAANDTLGDEMPYEMEAPDLDPSTITEKLGIAEQCSYQMFLSTPDPRMSIVLSIIVRALLVINGSTLADAGIHNPVINQSDLQMNQEMLPFLTYPRVVTLSGLTYFTVPVTQRMMGTLLVTLTPKV